MKLGKKSGGGIEEKLKGRERRVDLIKYIICMFDVLKERILLNSTKKHNTIKRRESS